MFALIIPAIIGLAHLVFGVIEPTIQSTIEGKLSGLSLGSSLIGDVVGIFKEHMTTASQAQQDEFQLRLQSMMGQISLNDTEAKSESFFDRGWRPFIAWGLGSAVVFHTWVYATIDFLHLFHIEISQIAPIDHLTFLLISGILGFYITARTYEKSMGVN